MKLKGVAYVYIVLMVILLAIIGSSLMMESLTLKLLPLIISSVVFILCAVGLAREVSVRAKPEATGEGLGGKGGTQENWRGYFVNGTWVVGFALGIYLLGYIIALPIFILAYMKWLGTRWRLAIVFAIITPLVIYGSFEVALKVPLYRGLILTGLGY